NEEAVVSQADPAAAMVVRGPYQLHDFDCPGALVRYLGNAAFCPTRPILRRCRIRRKSCNGSTGAASADASSLADDDVAPAYPGGNSRNPGDGLTRVAGACCMLFADGSSVACWSWSILPRRSRLPRRGMRSAASCNVTGSSLQPSAAAGPGRRLLRRPRC